MYEDKELQEYRDLLPQPTHFEEGFDWKTIVGAVFIGFLMMPGSMYLQLVIGTGIGPAARWVTIILFAEVAKRSYTELKQQEIFLLYYMAGAALASPFQGLLWNQYLVQSDAARMLGLTEFIPTWVAPPGDSLSMVERTFFHRDWLIPILLLVGSQIIQRIDHFGLGYALYRITSDVEKLPFPMAPSAPSAPWPWPSRQRTSRRAGNGGSSPSAASSGWRSGPSMCCCPPCPGSFSRSRSA